MQISTRNLALFNVAGLAAVLVLNYLSNALPLNGKTPGQLSDQYPNLFVPAGQTFAIWGAIYLLLIIWGIWQLMAVFNTSIRNRIEPALQKVGLVFLSTCLYNIAWLLAWHWEQVLLSVFIMSMLFLRLIRLNNQSQSGFQCSSVGEKWLMHAPFGIYWGWISIALIANVTALLVSVRWDGWGQPESFWTVLMIGIGTLLAGLIVWTRHNIFYGLAVMWALYGIYLKRSLVTDDTNSQLVAIVALSCLAAISLIVLFRVRKWLAY